MFFNLIKRYKIAKCDLLLIYSKYSTKIRGFYPQYKNKPVIVGLKFEESKNNVPIVKTIFRHEKTTLRKLISYAEKKKIQIELLNTYYNEGDFKIHKKIPSCKYKEIAELYSKQRFSIKENTTYELITKFSKAEKFLKLQIGYGLIPLVIDYKYNFLGNFVCELKNKIFYNTGIVLPSFVISDNLKLKTMEFVFIINGEIVFQHDFSGIQLVEIGMYIREFVETEINKRLIDIINPKWLIEYIDNYDKDKLLYECLLEKHIPSEFILDVIHEFLNKNKKVDLNLTFDTILHNYERTKNIDEIISIIDWIQTSERVYQQKKKTSNISSF